MSDKYNFLTVNPRAIMTRDEIAHFEEAMSPHNTDKDAGSVDLAPYVQNVVEDFGRLLFNEGA